MANFEESLRVYREIVELRREGYTMKEIGAVMNMSAQAVSSRLVRGAPKKRPTNRAPVWEGKPRWLRQGRERTRELVRHRDGYTCQDCGKVWKPPMRRLDVHHLNGECGKKSKKYDAVSSIDEMVTLCHKCHYNRPEHKVKSKKWGDSIRERHKKRKK